MYDNLVYQFSCIGNVKIPRYSKVFALTSHPTLLEDLIYGEMVELLITPPSHTPYTICYILLAYILPREGFQVHTYDWVPQTMQMLLFEAYISRDIINTTHHETDQLYMTSPTPYIHLQGTMGILNCNFDLHIDQVKLQEASSMVIGRLIARIERTQQPFQEGSYNWMEI